MDRTPNTFTLILVATLIGLVSLSQCRQKPQTLAEKIDLLQHQIVADSTALHHLENIEYKNLKDDFIRCDAGLQRLEADQVETVFESLNLTQAYIGQFEEVCPDMRRKMRYSLLQLDRLKADADSHYITDSLALAYLETERRVADTLHSRVAYFQEKLDACHKDLDAIKKKQH